jgi:hypothetical protein
MTDRDKKLSCLPDNLNGEALVFAISEVIGDVNLQ